MRLNMSIFRSTKYVFAVRRKRCAQVAFAFIFNDYLVDLLAISRRHIARFTSAPLKASITKI